MVFVLALAVLSSAVCLVCSVMALRRLDEIAGRLDKLERTGVLLAPPSMAPTRPRRPLQRRIAEAEKLLNERAAAARNSAMAREQ